MAEASMQGTVLDMPTIAERDSDISECESPATFAAFTGINDFGDNSRTQGSRPDSPPTFGPPASTWPGGSNNGRLPLHTSKKTGIHHSGTFAPGKPNRSSTNLTNASLSFEETAVWDRKSILSLGRLLTDQPGLLYY